jgi:hypothetical protein
MRPLRRVPRFASATVVGVGALALILTACAAPTATDPSQTDDSTVAVDSSATSDGDATSQGGVARHSEGDPAVTTIALAEPYQPTAQGSGTDDYRCFLIDLDFDTDRYITGVRFAPGNPAVVHHAIVYRVEPDQVAAARAKNGEDGKEGWSCFGGPGLPASSADDDAISAIRGNAWLAAWAPGGRESRTPEGTGVRVAAGSAAVLQMHYNLRGGQGPDLTEVHLRTVPGTSDLIALDTFLLPAPVELPCLPDESGPLCDRTTAVTDVLERFGGESLRTIWGLQFICNGDMVNPRAGSTQVCEHKSRSDMRVYAASGHMHLLGRMITIEHVTAGGEKRLLDIDNWDFDNQARIWLDDPVTVAKGDVLRVSCTHDANLRRMLPELADLPPRHVVWGDGTADEMCLGILTVARA